MSQDLKYKELLKALEAGHTDGSTVPSAELDIYTSVWDTASAYKYADAGTEACWQQLKAGIADNTPVIELKPAKPLFRLSYLKWAAVVVLAVGLGLTANQLFNRKQQVFAGATYQTQKAQTKTITLADGSGITLNAGSKLTVEEGFNNAERRVSFSGEAFFDISKDAERPFIISHKDACITVLGTSFNVACYPESNILKVALKTGKVRMSAGDSYMDIVPGEVGLYNQLTKEFSKISLNTDKELGWLNDKMVFENEKLSTIITELERRYNVNFTYNKSLDNEKITVTFSNQTLDQVVSVLEKTLGTSFSYTKN